MSKGAVGGFYCDSISRVVWSFNGGVLPSNVVASGDDDQLLFIEGITSESQGVYECLGTNGQTITFRAKGVLKLKQNGMLL